MKNPSYDEDDEYASDPDDVQGTIQTIMRSNRKQRKTRILYYLFLIFYYLVVAKINSNMLFWDVRLITHSETIN